MLIRIRMQAPITKVGTVTVLIADQLCPQCSFRKPLMLLVVQQTRPTKTSLDRDFIAARKIRAREIVVVELTLLLVLGATKATQIVQARLFC